VRGLALIVGVAVLAGTAAARGEAAGAVDRTVTCATSASGTFHVEYAPYERDGWFAVDGGLGIALVEVGSGRGFVVSPTRCRTTNARVALTRNGIRGRWLVYESQPFCNVPGLVVAHVRGVVHENNTFTGQAAVRTSKGVRIAYATFDRDGTAKAYVSRRCAG